MSPDDKATLATIEALLVSEAISVRDALHAAFRQGEITGQLEMLRFGERAVLDLAKELPT